MGHSAQGIRRVQPQLVCAESERADPSVVALIARVPPEETAMLQPEFKRNFSLIIARAWSDDGFKRRLLENPNAILREFGIEVPPGVGVRVVDNTSNVVHVVLPP